MRTSWIAPPLILKARALAKRLVLAPDFGSISSRIWLGNARRDEAQVLRMADKTNYKILDIEEKFFGSNRSGTLFILGSGSSINELSNHDFEHIAEHISIGINAWLIHEFIPTAYSLEYEKAGTSHGLGWKRFEKILSSPGLTAQRPQLLHLRPAGDARAFEEFSLPTELEQTSTICGRANIFSKSLRSLDRDIEALLTAYGRGRVPNSVLPDNGASVVRLIFFGLFQGFRKIVLVGIDLNTRPYFWHEENTPYFKKENLRDFPRASGVPHDTLDTTNRPFRTDDVVFSIGRVARKVLGADILVGSGSSALAKLLPIYEWPQG